jgi:sigma-B regulation protein RsbU (phosphoserine phosphatase)
MDKPGMVASRPVTLLGGRQQNGVDDVDDAIARRDVGLHHLRVVGHHAAVFHRNLQRLAVRRLDRLEPGHLVCRDNGARSDDERHQRRPQPTNVPTCYHARMVNEPTATTGPIPPADAAEWLALKDRALEAASEGFTIADARLPAQPLIYANQGFERITGYSIAEVMGRNCKFLQGPDTDPAAAADIRAALAESRPCLVEILNYRKDGTVFWNRLSITPVRDADGTVTHFIGVQSDITARRQAEDALRRSKAALEHDMRLAARVQQALLPPRDVVTGALRIAHAFQPCVDLAGDGLGIVPLPDDRVGLYLLDVSGHGVGAALLSFTLNHLLSPGPEGALLDGLPGERGSIVPPALVAERLNRQFPMDRSRQYFTFAYSVIDARSGVMDYVIAGHPAPVLVPRNDAPVLVAGGGFPIGMLEHAAFENRQLTLEPGDRLYFYTDGVVEALDAAEREYGVDRLLTAIERYRAQRLRASIDAIAAEVRDWCSGRLGDDVSLLAVEREA